MLLETPLPFRYVVDKVRADLITVLAIATIVEAVLYFGRDYMPSVPAAIPAFLGTAISLILSFKLNQSYDRWWEARKIWGAIVNDSRTFVRQLLSFVDGEESLVRRMGHRQIAWCYALGQSLRSQDWSVGCEGHLSEEDTAVLRGHNNKPSALLLRHAEDLATIARNGALTDYQRVAIDGTLTRLTDSMGKAERIRNTVFPRTYRVFLHVFIYIFVTLLAVAIAEIEGVWQLATTTAIAVPFLLLERTAAHMQDPFTNRPTDTPVTSIARTIEINLLQMMNEGDLPPPLPDLGFYVM